jgi:hypothetical protein
VRERERERERVRERYASANDVKAMELARLSSSATTTSSKSSVAYRNIARDKCLHDNAQ